VFVTFEGVGGSGKSSQAQLLVDELTRSGEQVVLTREPGGTALGEHLRETLLFAPEEISLPAEAALFAAARAQLVAEVIGPALDAGSTVVCDRYLDSSLAYQGIARGLGVDRVLELNLALTNGLLPDTTFLLLLDVHDAVSRREKVDRIERADKELIEAVDRGYRELAGLFPDRIVTLDATKPQDALAQEILERVREHS
jgi:dTMP kinase